MKPAYNGSRSGLGVRMSPGRGQGSARGVRWAVLMALVFFWCAVLVLPVAAEDSGVNSTATLRISASVGKGIGLDVEPVEDEYVEIKEETYVEDGVTKIKKVVSLGDTVVEPPERAQSAQKESDLKITVLSNYDTSWQLKVSSSNEGYMVSTEDPSVRMKNPFYFLQDKSDPRFTYVQETLALLLDSDKLLIRGNSSVTNVPIKFGTQQEVTWDDMLQADRYRITLHFGVGAV